MVGLNWTTELGNFMVIDVDYGVVLAGLASQLSHLLWLWESLGKLLNFSEPPFPYR